MEKEIEYVLIGADNYGATFVRRDVTRENLENEVANFCELENIPYTDITVCEVVPVDISLTVRLATD